MTDASVLTIDDYLVVASVILGCNLEQARRACKIGLAESALAAPSAGFGDEDRYPEPATKVAVLVERLARNHPLPDGNKRAAFVCGVLFAHRLGLTWGPPDADVDAGMVESIASGEAELDTIASWVRARTTSRG